jgi:hypothetical protein
VALAFLREYPSTDVPATFWEVTNIPAWAICRPASAESDMEYTPICELSVSTD